MDEFSGASTMWVKFPDGNEAPWVAPMEGSRKAAATFARCVLGVAEAKKTNPTQPHNNAPATSQPFGKQAPTQPFERKPVTAPQAGERGA
jgi:hypothetical protein